jgi:eukaryotic-like serine/threonine-protein kinase
MTTALKAGRYEIIGELGRGAMGVVYKATDPVIGRTVAVKTIKLSEEGTGMSRPELLTRFQTEARAAGLLTHPNIVVVFDAGEENGLYYITMELVEGKSLQAHLDAGQAFALPRVLRIMEQTCSALQFAHERNVVHRDVKPANIMLTADDTVKVTDFGTAKILQFGTMQQTAHVMGTPSYMSPEQVKGRAVDGRSDIFSLGVMLYEMVTGEKPFPGQNITTVIYKIVNEEPVPPRQIDPSIHPGISSVVMKALAKEPEARYQSCREMLEDLRNYRNVAAGANADKTVVMGSASTPNATLPLGVGPSGPHTLRSAPLVEDPMVRATTLSLNARAATPTQTPVVRKTGPLPPVAFEEPKKKSSVFASVVLALLLIGLIAYGVKMVLPVIEDARKLNAASKAADSNPTTTATAAATPSANTSASDNAVNATAAGPPPAAKPEPAPAEKRPAEAAAEKPLVPKKTEPMITPQAAEYKGRIEEAFNEKGLADRAKVQAIGSTLILSGKLRPAEHGALLKFLRDAPSSVRLVDHIEYEDAPPPDRSADVDGGHPVPQPGRGAIHLVTDLVGATAILHGPAGRILNQCQAPCSFNDLVPQRYSLEVQKDGYQSMQTALQVKAGQVIDQKATLESIAKGLYLTSKPSGADVFINGARQSGQTPVTLPLAPGQYNLVVRMPGYDAYAGSVQVKENVQTQLDVGLKEKTNSHVAWAEVDSTPKGAEIFVDGTTTGQMTPARVQIPAGIHTLTVKLDGYQPMHRTVQASEGGTVTQNMALKPK